MHSTQPGNQEIDECMHLLEGGKKKIYQYGLNFFQDECI